MRYAQVVLTTLLLSGTVLGGAGCHSRSQPSPARVDTRPAANTPTAPVETSPAVVQPSQPQAVQPEQPTGAAWSLNLKSKCEQTEVDQCLAGYGLLIQADGHYQLGPGPNNQVKSGQIAAEDLSKLTAALEPVLAQNRLAADSHQEVEEGAESEYTLTLTAGSSQPEMLVQTASRDLAFRTQSLDQAKSLLGVMTTLAEKYYLLPFPDTCADNVTSLQSLYSSAQTCSSDNDCAYFDSNSLEVLAPNAGIFVTSDDCTLVHPMVVGNANLVSQEKTKLMEALGTLRNSCGQRLYRDNCSEVSGFLLSGSAAVCKQGVCQANQPAPSLR